MSKNNAVGWFEIAVNDMDRAVRFYETIFEGLKLDLHDLDKMVMAWFPWKNEAYGAAGALVKNEEFYKPSPQGPLLYFSSLTDDVNDELSRVEEAGGEILLAKRPVGEHGFMGLIKDSEGNRIAIHSSK